MLFPSETVLKVGDFIEAFFCSNIQIDKHEGNVMSTHIIRKSKHVTCNIPVIYACTKI